MQNVKITKVGRYFLAVPMVVFGIQHFMYAEFVMQLVPGWIPAPLFWTYFTGAALFAAGAGIAINVWSRLAATLLGLMISIWVIILHIPRIFAYPGDTEFINVFDALFILSGAFLLSYSLDGKTHLERISTVGAKAAPILIAIALSVFGIEHFIHGRLVFIVGAPYYEIPGSTFWSYLTGIIFIVSAAGIVFRRRPVAVASFLSAYVLFIAILFYGPQLWNDVYHAHTWATFLKGMAMSGSSLMLANALSDERGAVNESIPLEVP